MTEPRVVVAHESEIIGEVIHQLCKSAGYAVKVVSDGQAALAAMVEPPAALVVDVALPLVPAYELVADVKRRAPQTAVILVASIYNRASYKRRPTSLYGADDYVEQHHLPDALLGKLERLIGARPVTFGELPHSVDDDARGHMRAAAAVCVAELPQAGAATPEMIARAERLARLIVADIALYNGDLFAAAGQEELEARFRCDLEEGRLLFDLKVPRSVRQLRDFIGEALTAIQQSGHVIS